MTRRSIGLGRGQRGAAILIALIIVTITAAMAVGMFVRQDGTIASETARRQAAQARWILRGALDWTRLILREDARTGGIDHLGEPWALQVAPISLKTFLAVNEQADDAVLDAQIVGNITDLQGRYNLRNLASEGQVKPEEVEGFKRLLEALGASNAASVADGTAASVAAIVKGQGVAPVQAIGLAVGLEASERERLAPLVTWLPTRTPVNVNTASAPVLVAAVPGLSLSDAKGLIERRASTYFRDAQDFLGRIPGLKLTGTANIAANTQYFEVTGALLWGDMTIEQRAIVQRAGLQVRVVSIAYGPTMPN
jgi:general secretion pathway protein K